jgi:hypothetical protein
MPLVKQRGLLLMGNFSFQAHASELVAGRLKMSAKLANWRRSHLIRSLQAIDNAGYPEISVDP